MEINLEWKTTLFSPVFGIYRDGMAVGEISKGNWTRKVAAELNLKKIVFEVKGVFRSKALIIDTNDDSTVGSIDFSGWKSNAAINYREKLYKWHFDNFFRTRWSILDGETVLVKYHSGALSGTISSMTGDEILILTGFFIRNLIRQRSAGIAAST